MKFESSENWKTPVEKGSECSEKWKNWKSNNTEKENKNTTEMEVEEGTEQEMKAGSEGKEDPYRTYMKKSSGKYDGTKIGKHK